MALQLRRYGRSFMILLGVIAVGLAAGFYILIQQRLPNPFKALYPVNAAFPTAAAVVPGLGEPVNVAGVHVGVITNTYLKGGQGIIQMQIDPTKGVKQLYCDAHASLVPNTPLKDMQVDINPGTPGPCVLKQGATIPIAQSTSPIDSDELLDSLDGDTRAWFTSLITELDNGTRGRGLDIRSVLRNIGPTSQQLRTVADLLAQRRVELASLVHNLGTLSKGVSASDSQLTQVVRAGDQTIQALAAQSSALQASVSRLPGTLATARSTLTDLTSFANQLAPTATALIPTVRQLPATLRDARQLIQGAALLPVSKLRAFEAAVAPLAAQLPATERGLNTTLPRLSASFKVVRYALNELSYTPGGGNQGFLYWLGWLAHNIDSFVNAQSDANGRTWNVQFMTSCRTLNGLPAAALLKLVLGSFGC